MKYIDLFGGVGGFRYGIEKAYNNKPKIERLQTEKDSTSDSTKSLQRAASCVFYNDIDKYAVSVYNKRFNENYEPTDIRTVKASDIPDFDMLCAGFPCQAFSIAGKRRGFKDTRGTLFFEIARIVKAKKPKILLLENVKGLLNHEKGKTFSTILQTLDELGYEVQWMVLNSKFFGVPQNRERVFIIGSLRGECRPEILPFRENAGEVQRISKEQIISGTVTQAFGRSGCSKEEMRSSEKIARCLDANYYKGVTPKGYYEKKRRNLVYTQERKELREHKSIDETPTLKQRMGTGGNNVPMVQRVPLKYLNRNQKNIEGDYSYTVDGANTGGINDGKLRRLTTLECERLQGFPDNWTAEGDKGKISDTQRYKMMGNAVTTNVITAITNKIINGK